METFRVEPPVVWEVIAVSYEKGNTTEGASKKITEIKAIASGNTVKKFTREEVISLIDNGKTRFVVAVPPKPSIRVVPKEPTSPQDPCKDRYLRSDADEKLTDNLGALSEYDAAQERLQLALATNKK